MINKKLNIKSLKFMSFFIKKTKLKNVFVLNFSEFKDHRENILRVIIKNLLMISKN